MKSDIIVIGGGAAGLMAAWSAASTLLEAAPDRSFQVTVLEKMPRPARKVMITGKGRCNFTNLKDWNGFSPHIRANSGFVRQAFFNFPPAAALDFFEGQGMKAVVERGDRAFPASYRASDVVDTLVRACNGAGVRIVTESAVESVTSDGPSSFRITVEGGGGYLCRKVILATGGLSYPDTGSTGDGLRWSEELGHRIVPTFPSLTALVPEGYKTGGKGGHIERTRPMTSMGAALAGLSLKNVGVRLMVGDTPAGEEFGDIEFTDGGLEGPVGFQLSRKAVKSMVCGSKVSVTVDLKPAEDEAGLAARIAELKKSVDGDPRSRGVPEERRRRVLLGKLLPRELVNVFAAVKVQDLAAALKSWRLDIAGYVGYERAVVTAGGVNFADVVPKTLESRKVPGLHFAGEILDCDCDTGGYNLQTAFSTGVLAGRSAARSLCGE